MADGDATADTVVATAASVDYGNFETEWDETGPGVVSIPGFTGGTGASPDTLDYPNSPATLFDVATGVALDPISEIPFTVE